MRKIAIIAVAFALLGAIANIHMAAAQAAQHVKQKPADTITVPSERVEQQSAAPSPVIVTVKSGDTLSGIAATHNTTYVRLYDANGFIANPDLIFPGQQISVPVSDEQIPAREVPVSAPAPKTVAPTAVPVSTPAPAPVAATAATPMAAVTPARVPSPAPPSAATGDSAAVAAAKAYIYAHESGNNPDAINPNGCYGLGQDCSGQVRALCGDDFACQDEWFTNYANSRYGGWVNAEAFWQAHGWW